MNLIQGNSSEIVNLLTQEVIKNSKLTFFKSEDLNYDEFYWFVCYNESQIIGVIKTQKSIFSTPEHPFMAINYISITPQFQNQGIASKLLELCFTHFAGGYLMGTDFSDEGMKLVKKMRSLAIAHDVYYVDPIVRRNLDDFNISKKELYFLYKK